MAIKRIIDLPTTDTLTGNTSVLVNDNGTVKMGTADAIQADWNETDETSPKFIMNKPTSLGGNGGCPLYVITNNVMTEMDGTLVTLSKFCTDYLNGPIRTVLDGYQNGYNPDLPLESNMSTLGEIGTVVEFFLSSDEAYYIETTTAYGNKTYKTPFRK